MPSWLVGRPFAIAWAVLFGIVLLRAQATYWAGRATLVARAADIPIYDEAFQAFFGPPAEAPRPTAKVRLLVDVEAERGLASPLELLKEKSFSRCSHSSLRSFSIAIQTSCPVGRRSASASRERWPWIHPCC